MIQAICVTDKGLCRSHNEDSYCLNGQAFQNKDFSFEGEMPFFACVFDGVGGAACGDKMSYFCAQEMAKSNESDFAGEESFKRKIGEINELAIQEFGANKSGSTLAGVCVNENSVSIFNIGDSRVYRASLGILMQYSSDDTAGSGITDHRSHAITNYFGNPNLASAPLHFHRYSWDEDFLLLVCSDGVYDCCDLDEIFSEMENASLEETAKKIKEEVFAHGANDNMTFILVQNKHEGEKE